MISIQDLCVTFDPGGPLERRVLSNLSLEVHRGDFVTIIGTNGAGKSTLLGAIAGEVLATSGRIIIAGRDVTEARPESRAALVARVFQDPVVGSCSNLTVAENLALASARGRPRLLRFALGQRRMRTIRERVAELGTGLEDRMQTRIGALSGGQRQALALVMATLAPSEILLLDEHTAALDPANAEFVLSLTRQFAQQFDLTVLMVTHSMRHALEFGSRTLMLHDGSVALDLSGTQRAGYSVETLVAEFKRQRRDAYTEASILAS